MAEAVAGRSKKSRNKVFAVTFDHNVEDIYRYRLRKKFRKFGKMKSIRVICKGPCSARIVVRYYSQASVLRALRCKKIFQEFGKLHIVPDKTDIEKVTCKEITDREVEEGYKFVVCNLSETEILNEFLDMNDDLAFHSRIKTDIRDDREIGGVILKTNSCAVYGKYLRMDETLFNGKRVMVHCYDELIRIGVHVAMMAENNEYKINNNLSGFRKLYPRSLIKINNVLSGFN